MSLAHHLTPYLKQLRLSGILDTLEVRNQQAIGEQWSYLEFLTRLIQDEVERRYQKQLDLRVRRSGISSAKTLESFDFAFNPMINRQQVYDLATCEFIRQHRNALICGQTGVGKSHLVQSVAHEAARKGFDVLFTTAHAMLTSINAGRADGTYERRLAGAWPATSNRTCCSLMTLASSRSRCPTDRLICSTSLTAATRRRVSP
jgi:DNA replication protein DnaC